MDKHVQDFGTMRYEIKGIQKEFVGDIYHTLMRSSWKRLLLAAFETRGWPGRNLLGN